MKAKEEIGGLLALDPHSADGYGLLGEVYLEMGEIEASLGAYGRAIEVLEKDLDTKVLPFRREPAGRAERSAHLRTRSG